MEPLMQINIGIICALKLEMQGLQAACNLKRESATPWPFYRGNYKGMTIGLLTSGIGKVLASAATQWLIDYAKPKIVINWGCAGGINPQGINPHIQLGDIVASQGAVEYDYGSRSPRRISADKKLLELARAISGVKPGILATADQNCDSVGERKLIWQKHQALACDWESAAVLRVAAVNQVPALALRVVSDMGDCHPGPEFSTQANAVMLKAVPVLLEYITTVR